MMSGQLNGGLDNAFMTVTLPVIATLVATTALRQRSFKRLARRLDASLDHIENRIGRIERRLDSIDVKLEQNASEAASTHECIAFSWVASMPARLCRLRVWR